MKDVLLKISTFGETVSVEQKITLEPKEEHKRLEIARHMDAIVAIINRPINPLPEDPPKPDSPSE